MKKGFTLIEMMAVIIILGIITLIAVPLVEKALSDIRQDAYKTQIENIRKGARQWGANHFYELPDNDGGTISVNLETLKLAGYVEKVLVNPKTNEEFPNDMLVTILNDKGNYVYIVDGDEGEQLNPYTPTITLLGDALIYVNLNASYTEPGIVAKTSEGVNITDYTTVIQKDGIVVGSIDSSGLYNYTITYTASHNGLTAKAIRNVIIKDNVPPNLVIPVDSTITTNIKTFDLMEGVYATDNSGELVIITSNTTLTLGIPGKYITTYTAKDKTGNTTIKERTITIVLP